MTPMEKIVVGMYNQPPMRSGDIMQVAGKPSDFAYSYITPMVRKGILQVVEGTRPKMFKLTESGELQAQAFMKYYGLAAPVAEIKEPVAEFETVPQDKQPEDNQTNVQVSPLDRAIEALASALVARVSDVVELKINDLVGDLVIKQVTASIEKLTQGLGSLPAPAKEKPTLPRIMIGGLLAGQEQMIASEFGSVFDLRFVGTAENTDRWKSNATHADAVFVMQGFISHTHTDALKSVKVKPILVDGGMTALRDKLTEFYMEIPNHA